MLTVDTSDKEQWLLGGVATAGFWSRWYLWSQPTIEEARTFMSRRFGITFV